MIFAAIMPFAFYEDGNSARRDGGATPEYLGVGMDFEQHEVWLHPAGDRYVCTRCVFTALTDASFINRFERMDAARIALEDASARRTKADHEAEALKSGEGGG